MHVNTLPYGGELCFEIPAELVFWGIKWKRIGSFIDAIRKKLAVIYLTKLSSQSEVKSHHTVVLNPITHILIEYL